MDRDEALRLVAERMAQDHAARHEALWANGTVAIDLIRSPDDPATFSAEYQAELRSLLDALRVADIAAVSRTMALDSAESFGGQLGEFAIPIVKYGLPALSGIIVGWLKGRAGRKVKVEFFADGGPKKIEAPTADEVITMLEAVRREARQKPNKTYR